MNILTRKLTACDMRNVLFTTILLTLLLSACNKNNGFLGQTVTTDLTESAVFSDSARSMDYLAGIYANMDFSFKPTRFTTPAYPSGLAGIEACSDEAEGPASSTVTTYNQFVLGSVGPYSITPDAWNTSYANIRSANQWLRHLSIIPISNSLKNRTKGEALFLRAWYYFIMLKHYGGVPLIGDTVYNVSDKISSKRNTYAECVDYITAQCDSAVMLVPTTYTGLDFGRITKGACLALKARVLLYAASPLFNGGSTAAEPLKSLVGYPSYDANRWQLAADAAQLVINTTLYSLVQDNTTKPGYGFYQLFQSRQNSEYILERMYPRNGDLENLWRPPSRGGSSTAGSFPYQNLVDAFGMSNGKTIDDPASGYDPANPYANRDPRLDYTVSHNGSMIYKAFGTIEPIYTYDGEPNGDGFGVGSPTGMYINKMCNDNVVPNWLFADADRCFPLIRYADILLMYAEAANEATGPSTDVYNAVETVRQRAGLSPYQLPSGLTQDDMRKVIQHERQVEFAFEESRFWDVRRWKIASTTDNRMMTGMRVIKDASGNFTYMVTNVRSHSFREPMYLWPIPQSEAGKSSDMVQNPGY